jgi:hypothetical protein
VSARRSAPNTGLGDGDTDGERTDPSSRHTTRWEGGMVGRLVKLGSAAVIASIRIAILVAVLHRATRVSWQQLTIIAACVVFGLLIAPHLIGHRARPHTLLRVAHS